MARVHNKHQKTAPLDAVYIGRGSKWGNPFIIGKDGNRNDVIEKYKSYLKNHPELVMQAKIELKDKDLVCYCYPKACHGDLLLKIANETKEPQ